MLPMLDISANNWHICLLVLMEIARRSLSKEIIDLELGAWFYRGVGETNVVNNGSSVLCY